MPTRHPIVLALAVSLLASACGDAVDATFVDPATPPETTDFKADRSISRPLKFVPIDARHALSGSARGTLLAALASLDRTARVGTAARQKKLAAETLARIQAGDVLIGALDDARGADLWHMCKDLDDQRACPTATPPGDPGWAGNATLFAALRRDLDGYTWGNRLYFNFGTTLVAEALATTLVHEVDHALNRSECSYYEDYFGHVVDPTLAFLEEYRAFVAECVYKRGKGATAARCDVSANAELVAREYGFTPDLSSILDPADVARGTRPIAEGLFADDGAFGAFIPTTASWPRDFAECETPP